jgi:hypothetical protein
MQQARVYPSHKRKLTVSALRYYFVKSFKSIFANISMACLYNNSLQDILLVHKKTIPWFHSLLQFDLVREIPCLLLVYI